MELSAGPAGGLVLPYTRDPHSWHPNQWSGATQISMKMSTKKKNMRSSSGSKHSKSTSSASPLRRSPAGAAGPNRRGGPAKLSGAASHNAKASHKKHGQTGKGKAKAGPKGLKGGNWVAKSSGALAASCHDMQAQFEGALDAAHEKIEELKEEKYQAAEESGKAPFNGQEDFRFANGSSTPVKGSQVGVGVSFTPAKYYEYEQEPVELVELPAITDPFWNISVAVPQFKQILIQYLGPAVCRPNLNLQDHWLNLGQGAPGMIEGILNAFLDPEPGDGGLAPPPAAAGALALALPLNPILVSRDKRLCATSCKAFADDPSFAGGLVSIGVVEDPYVASPPTVGCVAAMFCSYLMVRVRRRLAIVTLDINLAQVLVQHFLQTHIVRVRGEEPFPLTLEHEDLLEIIAVLNIRVPLVVVRPGILVPNVLRPFIVRTPISALNIAVPQDVMPVWFPDVHELAHRGYVIHPSTRLLTVLDEPVESPCKETALELDSSLLAMRGRIGDVEFGYEPTRFFNRYTPLQACKTTFLALAKLDGNRCNPFSFNMEVIPRVVCGETIMSRRFGPALVGYARRLIGLNPYVVRVDGSVVVPRDAKKDCRVRFAQCGGTSAGVTSVKVNLRSKYHLSAPIVDSLIADAAKSFDLQSLRAFAVTHQTRLQKVMGIRRDLAGQPCQSLYGDKTALNRVDLITGLALGGASVALALLLCSRRFRIFVATRLVRNVAKSAAHTLVDAWRFLRGLTGLNVAATLHCPRLVALSPAVERAVTYLPRLAFGNTWGRVFSAGIASVISCVESVFKRDSSKTAVARLATHCALSQLPFWASIPVHYAIDFSVIRRTHFPKPRVVRDPIRRFVPEFENYPEVLPYYTGHPVALPPHRFSPKVGKLTFDVGYKVECKALQPCPDDSKNPLQVDQVGCVLYGPTTPKIVWGFPYVNAEVFDECVRLRLLQPNHEGETDFKPLNEEERVFLQQVACGANLDVERWIEHQKPAVKREMERIYAFGHPSSLQDEKLGDRDLFIKQEKLCATFNGQANKYTPRVISSVGHIENYLLGPYVKAYQDALCEYTLKSLATPGGREGLFFISTCGMNMQQIGHIFYQLYKAGYCYYWSIDKSKFDSTVTTAAMVFEESIYDELLPMGQAARRVFRKQRLKTLRCKRFCWWCAMVEGRRNSGDPNTTIGNTILCGFCAARTLKGLDCVVICTGDDMVVCWRQLPPREVAYRFLRHQKKVFGFTNKLEECTHPAQVSYISARLIPVVRAGGDDWVLTPLPGKSLPKLFYTNSAVVNSKPRALRAAVASAVAKLYAGDPYIHPFLSNIAKTAEGLARVAPSPDDLPYHLGGLETVEAHQDYDAWFHLRYGDGADIVSFQQLAVMPIPAELVFMYEFPVEVIDIDCGFASAPLEEPQVVLHEAKQHS